VKDLEPKQALADDPSFLARLSELDRGLDGEDEPGAEAWPEAEPASPPQPDPDVRPTLPDPLPQQATPRAPAAPTIERSGAPAPAPPTAATTATAASLLPMSGPTPESFYGLTEAPFGSAPDLKFLYHTEAFDRASQGLTSAIAGHDDIVLVTGAAGTGKTMLCHWLISRRDQRTLTSLVSRHIWNVDDLLRTVLVDFGVLSTQDLASWRAGTTREELRATLSKLLESLAALQASALLIIDDAHTLDVDVLKELATVADGVRLQVVLAGRPDLAATVDQYELRDVAKRIRSRVELTPLGADDIGAYVHHRLEIAGPSARLEFERPASERLYEFSNGSPKVVNMLAERAIRIGFEASASVIDEGMIVDAAEHLNLRAAPPQGRGAVATMIVALSVVVSMLAGAGAAAWVFRDRVTQTISSWRTAK